MECNWSEGRKILAEKWGGRVYGNQHGRYLYLYGTYYIRAYYKSSCLDVAIENPKFGDTKIQFIVEGDEILYRWIKNGNIQLVIYYKKDGSLDCVMVKDDRDIRNILIIWRD